MDEEDTAALMMLQLGPFTIKSLADLAALFVPVMGDDNNKQDDD